MLARLTINCSLDLAAFYSFFLIHQHVRGKYWYSRKILYRIDLIARSLIAKSLTLVMLMLRSMCIHYSCLATVFSQFQPEKSITVCPSKGVWPLVPYISFCLEYIYGGGGCYCALLILFYHWAELWRCWVKCDTR